MDDPANRFGRVGGKSQAGNTFFGLTKSAKNIKGVIYLFASL
jgi:hypothetical protein